MAVGAQLVAIPIFLLVTGFGGSRPLALLLSGGTSNAWFLPAYGRRSRRLGWDSVRTRFVAIPRPVTFASVAAGLAMSLFPNAVTGILEGIGVNVADIPADAVVPSGIGELPLTVLVLVILVPLGEELLFRGLLLDWLKQKVVAWRAVVISSVAFALLHSNHLTMGVPGWILFADRFLLGVGASMVALRSGSLRGSFLMHAANNLVVCVVYALDL